MLIEKEYPYKPSWLMISICGLGFSLAGLVLGYKAYTNDRGLIINGLIEFSEGNASIFYWVLAGLSVGFVGICLALIFHRLKYNQRIAFGDTGLLVPLSRFSSQEKTIDYKDIIRLEITNVSGQKFLNIYHSGEKYIVNYNMLPSKSAFEELTEILNRKINSQKL